MLLFRQTLLGLLCAFSFALPAWGQQESSPYAPSLLLQLDNDYLSMKVRGADRYYSSGMFLGARWAAGKRNFLDKLMLSMPAPVLQVRELQAMQLIQTPATIGNPNVQVGDYPYAALLALRYDSYTVGDGYGMGGAITAGVIGPQAQGEQLQRPLHEKLIGSNVPQGWRHQLPNDYVLGYQLRVDKRLWQQPRVELIGHAQANAGFLFNDLQLGASLRLGRFAPFFSADNWLFRRRGDRRPAQIYLAMRPYATIVLGNVLLEGGSFNSPVKPYGHPRSLYYHIDRDKMERLLYGYSWSLNYAGGGFSCSFVQHFQSAQIKDRFAHEYAGVLFAFRL